MGHFAHTLDDGALELELDVLLIGAEIEAIRDCARLRHLAIARRFRHSKLSLVRVRGLKGRDEKVASP